MTEDFQKSSTHWGIGISEQYGFSMRKGASHFGLMITGQGSNRLKASNSIMSTIASFGKSSWITLSVAWRSSFLSQWGMPPKIQSRERLYKYTLQWALSSSFKKKNCQREERTPSSEDQHSSRWFSNWGWLGHNYSEVPNRRADQNKRAGLEESDTLLAYLLSKSINEQGGIFHFSK